MDYCHIPELPGCPPDPVANAKNPGDNASGNHAAKNHTMNMTPVETLLIFLIAFIGIIGVLKIVGVF